MSHAYSWFEIEELGRGIHRMQEGQGALPCNSYVIQDRNDALLIDTGLGIANVRALVESIADVTPRVLLTHAHWDHLGAAHRFDDVLVSHRERMEDGAVSLEVFEERFDHRPQIFIENWIDAGRQLPDGFDPAAYRIEPVRDSRPVGDGDEIPVGGRTVEIISTPGHSPGHLAALDRSAGVCWGGDILEPDGEIFAHFADADVTAYRRSIERLIDLRDHGAFDVLLTGHTDPVEDLSILDDVHRALLCVERGQGTYEIVGSHWGPSRRYEIDDIVVLTVHGDRSG